MRGYGSRCVATAVDAWLRQQMRGYYFPPPTSTPPPAGRSPPRSTPCHSFPPLSTPRSPLSFPLLPFQVFNIHIIINQQYKYNINIIIIINIKFISNINNII
jgi:hypothetical protein